jgi:hypothetical protein
MRKRLSLLAAITMVPALWLAPVASAKKAPRSVWQVSRSSDPITGASSCIVAAFDQAGGLSYSRTGAIYPFVENSSTHGVLVGVSSGGRMRLPTGRIVWRVDDKPYRTLDPADNPAGPTSSAATQDNPAMKQLVDQQLRLIASATATSTVAGGDMAKAMLAEMVTGGGLIFRAEAATQNYGLPTGNEGRVGLLTAKGLAPFPLDKGFRAGLAECGVKLPAP